MVRSYADRPVASEVVERCLRNAVRAPSAGFSQGWAFLVLDTPEDVRRWWATTAPDLERPDRWLTGMMRAPVLIVPCSSRAAYAARYAEPDKRASDRAGTADEMPYWHMDTAMAALLILQTAVDEGLGACFFGVPPDREGAVRREFGIPTDHDPIGVLTLGHLAEDAGNRGSPARRTRRPLDEVVHRGHWGGHWGGHWSDHRDSPPG